MRQYKIAFNQQARKFYAIRGTDKDGILTDRAMIASRLTNDKAEMQEFNTEKEAKEWISQIKRKFFAVRG